MAEDSLTAEEKFRLLLAISEAANSRLELSSVQFVRQRLRVTSPRLSRASGERRRPL